MIKMKNGMLLPNQPDNTTIDICHNMLLFGLALSLKPKNILELGIGSGYATTALLTAARYNQLGTVTCVDCCKDWNGNEPELFRKLRDQGARIIIDSEESFVQNANLGTFDLIVSDADHKKSHRWIDKTARMLTTHGVIFFHDTNNDNFPNLKQNEESMRSLGFSCKSFHKSSRNEERCERGWLMCFKESKQLQY